MMMGSGKKVKCQLTIGRLLLEIESVGVRFPSRIYLQYSVGSAVQEGARYLPQ